MVVREWSVAVALVMILVPATAMALGNETETTIGSLAWVEYEKQLLREEVDAILNKTGSTVSDGNVAAALRNNSDNSIMDVLSQVYQLVAMWEAANTSKTGLGLSPQSGFGLPVPGFSGPPAEWLQAAELIALLTSNMGKMSPPSLNSSTWSYEAQQWIMQNIASFGQWSAEQQRRSQELLEKQRTVFTNYYNNFWYDSPNWRRMESEFNAKKQDVLERMKQMQELFEQEWNRAYARVSGVVIVHPEE